MENFLIFPNQLYNISKSTYNGKIIYLVEEPRYFTDFKFHKLKLAYHRATMKKYYDYLTKNKYNIHYIEFDTVNDNFYKNLKSATCVDIADYTLENKLKKLLKLKILNNVNFLIKLNEINSTKTRHSFLEFYKNMRRKYNILMDGDKPVDGKWTFDKMNRLPLPIKSNIKIPITESKPIVNKYTIEAIKYVEKHFFSNYGSLDKFIYPIYSIMAKKWLMKFLHERLPLFGKYEDAISKDNNFIFHSVLTPMLNIGIITDTEVLKISNDFYLKNTNKIPIESYEGFIRQVIGWRNYVYYIYRMEGKNSKMEGKNSKMEGTNMLNHSKKISTSLYKKLWTGTTGIVPIDNTIQKIVKYGYIHHIERLMVLGNFMLLMMLNPNDVYKMFMEWTIDSYEWVMIPNVYGMSQYATNIMMTKPYFSSSNYILKISDFKKDGKWEVIWDALYYNFISYHHKLLSKNYGTVMQHWDDKTKNEQNEIKKNSK